MLTSLSIRNIAIIDQLDIDFDRGLTVMTGETGAGKTIVVQSLGLVLGARASTDYIRTGADEAAVAATFSLKDTSLSPLRGVREALAEAGIDAAEDEVIIRRAITAQGRSKITINGVPVTLQMLRDIACHLVDVSSQHENQLLIDPANHAHLIDDFGVSEKTRNAYRDIYSRFADLSEEVRKLRSEGKDAKERLDYLTYQHDELKAINPQPGELEELEERRSRMKHAVTLEATAREAVQLLYEAGGSAVEVLDRVQKGLSAASGLDPTLDNYCGTLERAEAELVEVARDLESYAGGLNAEPAEMEALEDRLHLLKGLIKKHGGDLAHLIEKQKSLAEEIDRAEHYDDILADREAALVAAEEELIVAADALSRERAKASKRLSAVVEQELAGLAMGKARFVAGIERLPQESWDAWGPDRMEFFISANVGEEPRPLAKTASGGELSRVMLAIKRVLADKANLAATYVFDEVDAGIGGATAEVVGRKLFEVAKDRQVLCITHLPQVACFGSAHYRIQKEVVEGRTVATMFVLKKGERVEEVARMLGGNRITDVTRKHAEELLESV